MTRIYHRGEWFHELSPTALSETEFESLLIQNAAIIQPDVVVVPYKKTVYAAETSARADLAMIARDYRRWFVVEVEMVKHDLYRHVLPQVRTLRDGRYDLEHARYLADKDSRLALSKVCDMLRGYPPEVLVLVNELEEEWRRELRRSGAHLISFQIFRSTSNRHIFVVDGGLPSIAQDIVTELWFSLLPRCLVVGSPAALEFGSGVPVPIFVDGQVTYWERFQTATGVYLTPIGSMPIEPGRKYALVRMEAGQHLIRPLGD